MTATRTPTRTPTAKPTATPIIGAPVIASIPKIIRVGERFQITGSNFTKGSVVNFFIATSHGSFNPGPLTPATFNATQLGVDVAPDVTLGQGFVAVQVIDTDRSFAASNLAYALLQGSAAAGIPSLTTINGNKLADTSSDPRYAANNVETVVARGSMVKLGGDGFDTVHGVAVDLFCACPGDKVGPFFLNPGNPGLSAAQISFTLPATGINAPLTGPGSFVISNRGADGNYSRKSNAVSAPIGARISVKSVNQSGTMVTVGGTGFSSLTVINLFNTQPGAVVNLGGLKPNGAPRIALTLINDTTLRFAMPAGAMPGSSYVQAFNPPFTPYTSSGNTPGGAFNAQ